MSFRHTSLVVDYSYGHYCEECGNWYYGSGYKCLSCGGRYFDLWQKGPFGYYGEKPSRPRSIRHLHDLRYEANLLKKILHDNRIQIIEQVFIPEEYEIARQRFVEEVGKISTQSAIEFVHLFRNQQQVAISKDWDSLKLYLLSRRSDIKSKLNYINGQIITLLNEFPNLHQDYKNEYNKTISKLNELTFSSLSSATNELFELIKKIQKDMYKTSKRRIDEILKTKLEQAESAIKVYIELIVEIGR